MAGIYHGDGGMHKHIAAMMKVSAEDGLIRSFAIKVKKSGKNKT